MEAGKKLNKFQRYCERVKRFTDLALKRRERMVEAFLKYENALAKGNYELAEAYVIELVKHQVGQERIIKKIEDLRLKYELGQFE